MNSRPRGIFSCAFVRTLGERWKIFFLRSFLFLSLSKRISIFDILSRLDWLKFLFRIFIPFRSIFFNARLIFIKFHHVILAITKSLCIRGKFSTKIDLLSPSSLIHSFFFFLSRFLEAVARLSNRRSVGCFRFRKWSGLEDARASRYGAQDAYRAYTRARLRRARPRRHEMPDCREADFAHMQPKDFVLLRLASSLPTRLPAR